MGARENLDNRRKRKLSLRSWSRRVGDVLRRSLKVSRPESPGDERGVDDVKVQGAGGLSAPTSRYLSPLWAHQALWLSAYLPTGPAARPGISRRVKRSMNNSSKSREFRSVTNELPSPSNNTKQPFTIGPNVLVLPPGSSHRRSSTG